MAKVLVKQGGKLQWVEQDDAPKTRQEAKAAGAPRAVVQPSASKAGDTGRAERDAGWAGKAALFGMNPVAAISNMANDASKSILNKMGLSHDAAPSVQSQVQTDLARRAVGGTALGLDKRARAAAHTIADVAHGAPIADSYKKNRDAEEAVAARLAQRTGLAGDVAEFGGSMAVPVVEGVGGAVGLGGKLLGRVGAAGGAAKAAKVAAALTGVSKAAPGAAEVATTLPLASRIAKSAVGGARAGAIGGGVQGLANTRDFTDVPQVLEDTGRGVAMGGLMGGGLGTVAAGAVPLARGIGAKLGIGGAKMAAGRSAVEGGINATNAMVEKGGGVARAEEKIQEMTDQGIQPTLADTSHQSRGTLRALMDKGVKGAEDVKNWYDERRFGRSDRFLGRLQKETGQNFSTSGAGRRQAAADVKAGVGAQQYKQGGVLDQEVKLSPAMAKAMKQGAYPTNPTANNFRAMLKDAIDTISMNPKQKPIDTSKPLPLRVFDEMLRSYRTQMDALKLAGQGNKLAAVRNQFDVVRSVLTKHNPQYKSILDYQAREIAKRNASELGDELGQHIFSDPRKILDITHNPSKPMHPDDLEELRYALTDRIMRNADTKVGAVNQMRAMLAKPPGSPQRKLAEFMFKRPKNIDSMVKYIEAERRAMETEARLAGSGTSGNLAGLHENDSDVSGALSEAGRLVAGVASTSPGMAGNAGVRLSGRLANIVNAGASTAAERGMMKQISRVAKPGDVTRLEQRAAKLKALRDVRRQKALNRLGRIPGAVVPGVTPGYQYDDTVEGQ